MWSKAAADGRIVLNNLVYYAIQQKLLKIIVTIYGVMVDKDHV